MKNGLIYAVAVLLLIGIAYFYFPIYKPSCASQRHAAPRASPSSPSVALDQKLPLIAAADSDFAFDAAGMNALLARAQKGDASAQYRIGRNYFYNIGLKRDQDQGTAWLCKAAL